LPSSCLLSHPRILPTTPTLNSPPPTCNSPKAIYPSAYPEGSLTKVALPTEFELEDYDDLTLETADGEKLRAYLLWTSDGKEVVKKQAYPNRKFAKTRPTVLFFHANAGNMGHRLVSKRPPCVLY
jgi:hypothetical protein